jgi:hypothetical protein
MRGRMRGTGLRHVLARDPDIGIDSIAAYIEGALLGSLAVS